MIESARNGLAILSRKIFAAVETKLQPRPDFDWSKLTWGRPDSVPSALCSYCSAVIPKDSAPLILWNAEGWTVRFCDKCIETEWGMK